VTLGLRVLVTLGLSVIIVALDLSVIVALDLSVIVALGLSAIVTLGLSGGEESGVVATCRSMAHLFCAVSECAVRCMHIYSVQCASFRIGVPVRTCLPMIMFERWQWGQCVWGRWQGVIGCRRSRTRP